MTDREKWIGGKGNYDHSSGLVHLTRPLHTQSGRRIAGSDHWFVYAKPSGDNSLKVAGPLTLRDAKIRGERAVRDIILRGAASTPAPAPVAEALCHYRQMGVF